MEDLSVQVLQGFRIRPKRIVKEKSYYICNTDAGYRVIRKSMDTKGHIAFQHALKEQLYQRGISAIDRYYLSADNVPFFEYEDNTYVMTDLFRQREADFSDNMDFDKVMRHVAWFHSTARELKFDVPEYYGNENILSSYRKQSAEMAGIKKLIGQKSRLSDFDVVFLKNYGDYSRQMRESIQLLEKTELQQAKKQAKEQNNICHNLLKEEHLLLDGDVVYIIGFSQAAVDYFMFDVCSIIQRYAKNLHRGHLGIYDILEIYDKYNPITKNDVEILLGLLKYPGKFIKICRQYYSKKRTWTPSAIINRMENIVAGKDEYDRFVESLLR